MLCTAHKVGRCIAGGSMSLQQVANYNDKFVSKRKTWREHTNGMRKTRGLRKLLGEIEPTQHDIQLDDAIRFKESEFRSQLLYLRKKWKVMYADVESKEEQYDMLEKKREDAIARILAEE